MCAPLTLKKPQANVPQDAWGTITYSSLTMSNGLPWQFSGSFGVRHDETTGLHYSRARWYDAVEGRFITRDPLGLRDDLHVYSYAHQNPLRYVDPSGLSGEALPGEPIPYSTPVQIYGPDRIDGANIGGSFVVDGAVVRSNDTAVALYTNNLVLAPYDMYVKIQLKQTERNKKKVDIDFPELRRPATTTARMPWGEEFKFSWLIEGIDFCSKYDLTLWFMLGRYVSPFKPAPYTQDRLILRAMLKSLTTFGTGEVKELKPPGQFD